MTIESNQSVSWIDRPRQRFHSSAGFLEEKLKTSMYIHFGLLYKFSSQIRLRTVTSRSRKWKTRHLTFKKVNMSAK